MVVISLEPYVSSIFDAHRGKHVTMDTGRLQLLSKVVNLKDMMLIACLIVSNAELSAANWIFVR